MRREAHLAALTGRGFDRLPALIVVVIGRLILRRKLLSPFFHRQPLGDDEVSNFLLFWLLPSVFLQNSGIKFRGLLVTTGCQLFDEHNDQLKPREKNTLTFRA